MVSKITLSLIQTVTVGAGGAASIDFTSIPQTGTDLLLVVSSRSSSTATGRLIDINGTDSGSTRLLNGSGSAATSTYTSNGIGVMPSNTTTALTFGNTSIYFPNYTGSTQKSFSIDNVTENNATAASQQILAGLWTTTSAITSISIGGGYAQYSTASLYTIQKGSGGASVA